MKAVETTRVGQGRRDSGWIMWFVKEMNRVSSTARTGRGEKWKGRWFHSPHIWVQCFYKKANISFNPSSLWEVPRDAKPFTFHYKAYEWQCTQQKCIEHILYFHKWNNVSNLHKLFLKVLNDNLIFWKITASVATRTKLLFAVKGHSQTNPIQIYMKKAVWISWEVMWIPQGRAF